jgi:lycopene beta-cyclase
MVAPCERFRMLADAVPDREPDLLLVGGGLANGLIAWRLAQLRPELDVRVIEAAGVLGGAHTWSFFETDLTPDQHAWMEPLIVHRWPGYSVRFPGHRRRLRTGYRSVTSERFDAVIAPALAGRVIVGSASIVSPTGVRLADGRLLSARAVIDGRGPTDTPDLSLGYQKFVGLEVRLAAPHGLAEPIIMDASVSQDGGYRFVYTLPLDDRTLLIEDTRYTDGAALDRDVFVRGVLDYADAQGWTIEAILREEQGVLPVALDGDLDAHFRRKGPTALAGLRAGLFHPTTGYSLPDAVKLADRLASVLPAEGHVLSASIQTYASGVWKTRGFYRLLNRMLFRAAQPERRYRILERFYRLPEPLIERFYAARSTALDKVRVLSGRPPVPITAALGCLVERGRA